MVWDAAVRAILRRSLIGIMLILHGLDPMTLSFFFLSVLRLDIVHTFVYITTELYLKHFCGIYHIVPSITTTRVFFSRLAMEGKYPQATQTSLLMKHSYCRLNPRNVEMLSIPQVWAKWVLKISLKFLAWHLPVSQSQALVARHTECCPAHAETSPQLTRGLCLFCVLSWGFVFILLCLVNTSVSITTQLMYPSLQNLS